ncbi:MAG: Holliday junction resolvase RuvX [Longimicrobiales bacterium]
MGIDYGVRRIGIAMSDPTRSLATPLTTMLRRRGKRPPIAAIARLVEEHDVHHIVVGIPQEADGASPDWTEEIRAFADKLAERTGRPVETQDESFSTLEAQSKLDSIGTSAKRKEQKGRLDAAAASIILQDWLDQHAQR